MPKRSEPTGFAVRLKQLREAAGLNQDDLADRAGLYKFSVAKLEQGVREPTWATVLALAHALGVEVGAFIVADVPPQESAPRRPRGRPRKDTGEGKASGQKKGSTKRRGQS